MDPAAYENATYYERWLFAAETILAEKGRRSAQVSSMRGLER